MIMNLLLIMQLLILSQFALVEGLYVLQLQLLGYSNPAQKRLFCNDDLCSSDLDLGRCCDGGSGPCTNGDRRCDSFFTYCLRPLGTPGFNCGSRSGSEIQSDMNENNAAVDFSRSTVLGLTNPINFPGLTNDWNVSVFVVCMFAIIILFCMPAGYSTICSDQRQG